MRLGREITAARRQASRLAGLVCFPVWRLIQTAIRRRASWLAPPNPLAEGLPKSPRKGVSLTAIYCDGSRIPARAAYAPRRLWGIISLHYLTRLNRQSARNFPTPQGVSLPHADSGKQKPRKGCVCPTPTMGKQKPSFVEAAKQSSCRNHVTPQGVRMPHANCGGAERR